MDGVLVGYIIASIVCVFPGSDDCVIKQEVDKVYQTEYGCRADLPSHLPSINAAEVDCVPVYRPSKGDSW